MGNIRYKMNTYTELINKNYDKIAFVLAAGPSLYEDMQSKCFKSLQRHGIVIAVNSAIIAFPNANYWISNDSLCRNWTWWKLVQNPKVTKIVRNSWLKYKKDIEGFYIFSPRPTAEDVVNSEDTGLCYCNSTNSAIDFAIQAGCKKIFICGLDHDAIDGKHHFWQFFPREKQPHQVRPAQAKWEVQKSVFPIHMKAYRALEKFSQCKKSKIYNCNPDSKVDCFKKIKFKKIEKYL